MALFAFRTGRGIHEHDVAFGQPSIDKQPRVLPSARLSHRTTQFVHSSRPICQHGQPCPTRSSYRCGQRPRAKASAKPTLHVRVVPQEICKPRHRPQDQHSDGTTGFRRGQPRKSMKAPLSSEISGGMSQVAHSDRVRARVAKDDPWQLVLMSVGISALVSRQSRLCDPARARPKCPKAQAIVNSKALLPWPWESSQQGDPC